MTSLHHRAWSNILLGVLCGLLWLLPEGERACAAESPLQLLFTSQGKSACINVDGTGQKYFNFSVPNQATWQPSSVFPDGKRLLFLSMEPRRDVSGKPFDEYYTQTPTHLWVHDLATGDLKEICTQERLSVFIMPALLLGDDRILIQVVRDKVGQIYSVRMDGSDAREFTRAGEGLPYGLSLSPDGKRVAFHLATPTGYQVWTSDVNGKQRQRIAADPDHLYFGTSWSSDSQSVLYVDCHHRDDPGHDWADVCVGKANGSQHRVPPRAKPCGSGRRMAIAKRKEVARTGPLGRTTEKLSSRDDIPTPKLHGSTSLSEPTWTISIATINRNCLVEGPKSVGSTHATDRANR